MLRALVWTLRQRRYAAISAFMALVAAGCACAGTFELHRWHEKRDGNARLVANAHAPTVALSPRLARLTGMSAQPPLAVRYRRVSVTGEYDAAGEQFLANRAQGGRQGFWVVTPLRTASGVLLVARGFVAAAADGAPPGHITSPPPGSVRVEGRLQTASTSGSQRADDREVTVISARAAATRLGEPVYEDYLMLSAGQPGAAGLRPLPRPGLANPTGGASEWQLLSYVVQWYVFGALALIAPFLFSRAEIRDAQRRFLGVDPDAGEWDGGPGDEVESARRGEIDAGASVGAALARRDGGAVAVGVPLGAARQQRAARLARRYGRSLGPDLTPAVDPAGDDAFDEALDAHPRRRAAPPDIPVEPASRSSAVMPHRSADGYHGSYNDYLWELALADGELADAELADQGASDSYPDPR